MLDQTKPYKGTLTHCYRSACASEEAYDNLGYLYRGHFVDHPRFAGNSGHTSLVVKEEVVGDRLEVETLNSRYTIILRTPEQQASKDEEIKKLGQLTDEQVQLLLRAMV